jgi:hypothetical protein
LGKESKHFFNLRSGDKRVDTLLLGLVKNGSQFSALSKTSGKKIRLGLSCLVEAILIPLSLTLVLSTCYGSGLL